MNLFPELGGLITAGLEGAGNAVLRLAPESLAQLSRLQDKVIAVNLQGTGQQLYLRPVADGLLIQSHHEGEADATLAGTPIAFAELSLSDQGNRVLFAGDVKISGDMKLGQDFKRILDEMDIDWEEVLSQYTGDVIAHKIGDLARGLRDWGKQAIRTTGQNAAEFFQQESMDLPMQDEVAPFVSDVDTLRDDVERLNARVQRLQSQLGSKE